MDLELSDIAGSEYKANQDVIIYSQSKGGWAPARIESCNADDSVTVRYASGHSKLVPIEYQSTHLKAADEAPPEPTLMNVAAPDAKLFGTDKLYGGPEPHLPVSLCGSAPPYVPSSQFFGGGFLGSNEASQEWSGEQKAGVQYTVGQDVMVYSESGKTWNAAKVTMVAHNGCVTVKWGAAQKTLEPARHHHLRPANSESGPQHSMSRVPSQSSSCLHGGMNAAPPEQAGTFQFDLSQLCNDAKMPGTAQAQPAMPQAPSYMPQIAMPQIPLPKMPMPQSGRPQSAIVQPAMAQAGVANASFVSNGQAPRSYIAGSPSTLSGSPSTYISAAQPSTLGGSPSTYISAPQPSTLGGSPSTYISAPRTYIR
jgi:hypothetical protein